jgi:hypothetical protein
MKYSLNQMQIYLIVIYSICTLVFLYTNIKDITTYKAMIKSNEGLKKLTIENTNFQMQRIKLTNELIAKVSDENNM